MTRTRGSYFQPKRVGDLLAADLKQNAAQNARPLV